MPRLKNLLNYIIILALLTVSSCANIGQPTGGPKDTEAPKLINKAQVDSLLNFKGGNLVIEFDEYIKLDNVQKNFRISPLTKQQPKIRVKKKSVIIELTDSLLEDNTTYTLDFGGAVRDRRENNQFKDLKLTLSTGDYFDSLSFRGKIYDAQSGKGDSSLVMLYPAATPDSMILKQKPLYITKGSNGNFEFKGLPNKQFKIAALADKNANYTYDALGEKIAFMDKVIDAAKPDSGLVLYSFVEEKMIDTTGKKPVKKRFTPKGALSYSFIPDIKRIDKMDYQDSLKIILGDQPGVINTDKIRFYENEVLDLSLSTIYDDSNGVVTLLPHWEMGSDYKLILQRAFIRDSSDKGSKADTLRFRTMAKEDYSSIIVLIDSMLLKKHAILLVYSKNEEIRRSTDLYKPVLFDLLKPTSYKLRLLYDENGNGKWDAGNLAEQQQPEITLELPKTIRLKPNWENKVEWNLFSKKKKFGAK